MIYCKKSKPSSMKWEIMHKLLYRMIIGMMLCIFLSGRLYASSMTEVNEWMQKKDYEKAIVGYEALIAEGYKGFGLFFNLGTCYQKTGNVPKAILNFEKALRIKPNHTITKQ